VLHVQHLVLPQDSNDTLLLGLKTKVLNNFDSSLG
jgi:hypothetical protein